MRSNSFINNTDFYQYELIKYKNFYLQNAMIRKIAFYETGHNDWSIKNINKKKKKQILYEMGVILSSVSNDSSRAKKLMKDIKEINNKQTHRN